MTPCINYGVSAEDNIGFFNSVKGLYWKRINTKVKICLPSQVNVSYFGMIEALPMYVWIFPR